MDFVKIAEQIAAKAHTGQYRNDGHTPYIQHPAAVVASLATQSDAVRAAAWLHDVLEDTPVTAQELHAAGIPAVVVTAVEVLTIGHGVKYSEYLERVSRNKIARRVKIADMLHNLSDAPSARQVKKYTKSLKKLGHRHQSQASRMPSVASTCASPVKRRLHFACGYPIPAGAVAEISRLVPFHGAHCFQRDGAGWVHCEVERLTVLCLSSG